MRSKIATYDNKTSSIIITLLELTGQVLGQDMVDEEMNISIVNDCITIYSAPIQKKR